MAALRSSFTVIKKLNYINFSHLHFTLLTSQNISHIYMHNTLLQQQAHTSALHMNPFA